MGTQKLPHRKLSEPMIYIPGFLINSLPGCRKLEPTQVGTLAAGVKCETRDQPVAEAGVGAWEAGG